VHEVPAAVSWKQLVIPVAVAQIPVLALTKAVDDPHAAQSVVEPLTTLQAVQPVAALPAAALRHAVQTPLAGVA